MNKALCQHCGRRWTWEAECHCPTCHRHFGNIKAFDRHRRSDACLDPATVRRRDDNPMFVAVERVSGPVWLIWSPTPHPWAAGSVAGRSRVSAGLMV